MALQGANGGNPIGEVEYACLVGGRFLGLVAGSALRLGAAVGYYARLAQRAIAAVMAFGSGVLISALSFNLMDEAYRRGGFTATAVGFLAGAAVFTAVNCFSSRHGARHRKRSGKEEARSASEGSSLDRNASEGTVRKVPFPRAGP